MGGRGAAFENKGYSAGIKAAENKIYNKAVEHAILVDANGNIVLEKTDNSVNSVRFTKDELEKMGGKNLTHNHPSNSTFSAEDIAMLTHWKLNSVRAVGEKRVYQLSVEKVRAFRAGFAHDYAEAMKKNKKVTDREYKRYEKQLSNGTISLTEFNKKIPELNKKLNGLNSDWLKKNATNYGYRYSVIERRK